MRVFLSILFMAVGIFAEDAQPSAAGPQAPDNLSIPAQLSRTIDTKNCKVGDVVELRTLEPVLIANGLVMPEHTKLQARILGAAPRQDDKPSWVLLVVQRAEWKDHSLPLRAFVASQITLKPKQAASSGGMNLSDFEHGRYSPRPQTIPNGSRARSVNRAPRDATDGADAPPYQAQQPVDELYIRQGTNGLIFLVTPKPHLKLPSGTMFMLRNRLIADTAPAAPQTEAGNPK